MSPPVILMKMLQIYVQKILKAIIGRKKFNIKDTSEDDYERYYLKKLIFTSACTFRVENCIEESKADFAKRLKNKDPFGETDP